MGLFLDLWKRNLKPKSFMVLFCLCFLCRNECDNKCANCDSVWFCCLDHQLLHQDTGTGTCYPYEVKEDCDKGRYLVATRTIEPGELVFKETPLVVGNIHDTPPICLGCWKKVEEDRYTSCKNCCLPLCGDDKCVGLSHHRESECRIFASDSVKTPDLFVDAYKNTSHPFYQCVTPLRCLLLKETHPQKWAAIQQMVDHVSDKPQWQWDEVQINVVRYLRDSCKLADRFSVEEINHVLGVLQVNAFEVTTDEGHHGRGVFPLTALMSHSCISNTRYLMNGEGHSTECRVNVRLSVGEEITDHYVSPLNGTQWRRTRLRDGWFFNCHCERCSDPTELGTFSSAFICSNKQCKGPVVATNSLDYQSPWECLLCQHQRTWKELQVIEEALSNKLEANDDNDIKTNQKALEQALVEHCGLVLHPSHYLMLAVKRYLVYLYDSDYNVVKEQFCRDLLHIYDVICPGLTKERGLTMFELHLTMLSAAKKRLASPIDFDTLRTISKSLGESKIWANEARQCLSHERPGSFEMAIFNSIDKTEAKGDKMALAVAKV